jgi:dUTP pyrophosphatase
MSGPTVSFRRLPHGQGLPAPAYESVGAAGMDLCAALSEHETLSIAPGDWRAVPTGFALAIPQGHEGQVRPRSGLAAKHGVTVLNAPGTIDCDYRGEVKVLLINQGREPFEVTRGMRIAQIVFARVETASLVEQSSLDETERGEGGFGSTGSQTNRRIA